MISYLHDDFFTTNLEPYESKVDLLLTDLPYGTIRGSEWDDEIDLDEFWRLAKYICKKNSVVISTASQPFTSRLIMSNLSDFQCTWVWNKKLAGNAFLCKYQPLKIHEDVVVFQFGKVTYNPQMTTGVMRNKMTYFDPTKGTGTIKTDKNLEQTNDQYYPTSIVEFSTAHLRGDKRFHLAQKPIGLFEYLIETYSDEDSLVFDPFMGSGTTLIAAKNLNRDCVGIEKDSGVIDEFRKRWEIEFNE